MTWLLLLLITPHIRADDVATIRERFVQSVLPKQPADVKRVNELAAEYAKSLRADGLWTDINYGDQSTANWAGYDHLARTLQIAKSFRLTHDATLRDKALLAMKAWTDRDPQNPNWWWNVIGVPELLGESTCVLMPDVPQAKIDAVVRILKRSSWERMTGANATWTAMNTIVRGCIEGSSDVIAPAYERMYDEVRIAERGKEGIQPDFSFQQHHQQFYSGSYGLYFCNDVGRFVSFAWGTKYQIPPQKMAVLSTFILDGEQWFIRGDVFDYTAVGREISRKGKLAVPHDWSRVSIAPAGPAYSIGNVSSLLAALESPRQAEFKAFAARLHGDASAPPFVGNKYFWCSDVMAHRRPAFSVSVKMFSTRMLNAENTLNEGKKAHHLADGAMYLYQSGDEYKDIFPAWDWNKIPGTTTEQVADLNTIEPNGNHTYGKTNFVGGVSDGDCGLCVMDLKRGKLTAHKAWFFFGDAFLCLGNSITLDGDNDVVTAINQCHLRGEVKSGENWIHHDNVGYIALAGTKLQATTATQSGKWSDIGAGTDEAVSVPVFNLWIDHGKSPKDATYQYLVSPGVTAEQTELRVKQTGFKVFANSANVQAVYEAKSNRLAIAFWKAGSVKTPLGEMSVDQPCLVLIRDGKAFVSNPVQEAMTVQMKVGDKAATVELPAGALGGSTVACELK
jgi:chondroitin AC lyase